MALPTMNREHFSVAAGPVIAAAAHAVDWRALLTSYEWAGAGWRAGLQARGRCIAVSSTLTVPSSSL